MSDPQPPTLEEIAEALRWVRPRDCGAHYCRYCPAKSPQWEHDLHCPYEESQRQTDIARRLEACLRSGAYALVRQPRPPVPHYWTPDPTKRFCVICGDNGLGSVWGIHRFQIQPGDPDFKEPEP